MKIAPLKVNDPWYGRIMNNGEIQTESLQGVPIESTVEMEMVELLHGGPESNYRPYLHLRGELTEAKPAVELPYGVTELAMRRGAGLNVDAFYDFNPRQLSDLVSKGYFTEAFRVPTEMSGIPWTLPGKADFLVVAPAFSDQPPLVFMNVHDQSALALDEANSDYDLSAYFPDYTPEAQEQAAQAVVVDGPERGGSGLDVFSDVIFDERYQDDDISPSRSAATGEQRASVPTGVFSRLVSEIEAQRVVVPEPSNEQEQEAIIQGSPLDVYLSRVSPGVEQVLAGEVQDPFTMPLNGEFHDPLGAYDAEQATSAVTKEGYLDLSEPDQELAPPAMETGVTVESAAEAHRKAAHVRTVRLLGELTSDEASATSEDDQLGL